MIWFCELWFTTNPVSVLVIRHEYIKLSPSYSRKGIFSCSEKVSVCPVGYTICRSVHPPWRMYGLLLLFSELHPSNRNTINVISICFICFMILSCKVKKNPTKNWYFLFAITLHFPFSLCYNTYICLCIRILLIQIHFQGW